MRSTHLVAFGQDGLGFPPDSKLARDAELPAPTAQRYLSLLVEAFIVALMPAWTRGGRKRLVKSPKVMLTDGGLATPSRRSRLAT